MFTSFYGIKRNFPTIFISFSLIAYPVTVLLIPKVNGLIFGLFALTGLVFLFTYRQRSVQTNREEALFYTAVSLFFMMSLLITIIGGFEYKAIGKYLHLILAIPIYIYLRQMGFKLQYLWMGLVAGAVMAAGIAVYEVVFLNLPRAQSLTHPIIFGDLALVMGCMSMACLGWFKQRANWQIIFPVFAVLCGVAASVLSVARGGWVAVPFIVLVFFWYIKSQFSFKQISIFAVMLIIFIGVIYAIPQTKVSYQVDRTLTSLQQYGDSEITSAKRATSVGTRLEMWQASWVIFLENPFVGVGWGHYKENAQELVDQGLRNRSAARFDHPHNEYFSALAHAGLFGFVVLMLLFLTPASLFVKYIKFGKTPDSQRLALAGLVLIVAYMAFGISEPMLYRSRSVNFFGFYLAIFLAGIYQEEHKLTNKRT